MHGYFQANVRNVRIQRNRLRFTYLYVPLDRWATCSFTLSGDTMAGNCDAETSAHGWGPTPSYLWREGVLMLSKPAQTGSIAP